MYAQLLNAVGWNVSAGRVPQFPGMPAASSFHGKLAEVWPPEQGSKYYKRVKCSDEWIIYKRPTNSASDLSRMLALWRAYPRAR